MDIEILYRPGQTVAKVSLGSNEEICAEPGSMLAMHSDMTVTSSSRTRSGSGGIMQGLKRMFAGESFFINTFRAPPSGGDIYFSPTLIGDMMVYEMDGSKELIVQKGSYVASDPNINVDISWQGLKSAFFSGESLFWVRLSGRGKTIFNSFGAIYEKNIDGEYIVDTGHIVAFENSLTFDIKKAGKSWFSSIAGGEGLVCRFKGKGKLYCQTHNPGSWGWALNPFLKPRQQ
jgi:uncharacterized protein (TIGR00266 family)